MTNDKGISMISLIITILLIIILAAITAPILSSIINDSLEADAKVELANVQAVVENAKTMIMTEKFIPNSDYIISNDELISKFGPVLTSDEIDWIEEVNNDSTKKAPYKYYLMNQAAFKDEFGSEFNVKNIRENREYLVNYMDGLVIVNYNGSRITNKTEADPIKPAEELVRGEVNVKFSPNGNSEWARQQSTTMVFSVGEDTTVYGVSYLWSKEVNEPNGAVFDSAPTISGIVNGSTQTTELQDETGNGWFLWVRVDYDDVGIRRTKTFRSDAFFIDNIKPTADFSVDEINR